MRVRFFDRLDVSIEQHAVGDEAAANAVPLSDPEYRFDVRPRPRERHLVPLKAYAADRDLVGDEIFDEASIIRGFKDSLGDRFARALQDA